MITCDHPNLEQFDSIEKHSTKMLTNKEQLSEHYLTVDFQDKLQLNPTMYVE